MIVGMGSDLIDIRRIERTLERFGDKFIERTFSAEEQKKANRRAGGGQRNGLASTYAKRFAAKEACSKALGTGFRQGVYMKDIGVVNLPSGRPTLELQHGAKAALERMIPEGKQAQIDVTLTDEYPIAQALVMISAL